MSINFEHTDAKQQWLTQRLKNFKTPKSSSEMTPQSRPANLPLSFAQQRLWFLEQWEPGSTAYVIPYAWRLMGPLDLTALTHSLTALVGRHESLRTSFSMVDGQPMQVIAPVAPVSLPVRDLTALSTSDREVELQRLIHEDTHQPFDLATPPLWRGQLLRLGPKDHVLLLTLHHIITDGWSMGIVWKELSALYTAHVAGQPAPLPPLPLQYADFAVWQRQWLQGDVLEQQVTYWCTQLADIPPTLDLPTDGPRPQHQTYRGEQLSFTLPPTLSQALKTLSQHEGVTLFMTLLAAFQLLLFRYTGQRDILVGAPMAGRSCTDLEGLIGFFVNTLVLRTRFTGQPTFRDVLQQVRETCLEAYAHQDLPFEKLVEALQPMRDPSRHPLFQVMFQLHHADPTDGFILPHVQVESLRESTQTAKFDLLLALVSTKEKLQGTLTFNTDLFGPDIIRRIARHYQRLLEGLVANPTQAVSHMSLLTDTEHHQLLIEWNDTTREYPRDKCVHALIEEQVERTPDAIAIVFEDQQMTYRELNKRVNRLGHYLQTQGVGPEGRVGLCVERSLDMVVGMLGILKAGGAYVPLDPEYPKDRLAFMLADAQPLVLLTHQALLDNLPSYEGTLVCLDAAWPGLEQEATSSLSSGVTPDHLAYIIYTSGSTGIPKGVMISHRAMGNHMGWLQQAFPLTATDCVIQKTSMSFDASVWEFFAPLLAGAKITLVGPNAHRDPAALIRCIMNQHVTVLQMVPTLFRQLIEHGLSDCRSLQYIFCGGEVLPVDLVRHWQATRAGKLVNLYGPTETTIDVLSWVCRTEEDCQEVPVGRPITNTQVYLLDGAQQLVPIGVAGECYIGGRQVGRGYLGRPELTAQQFLPHPFSREPGARLYKTGDYARYRIDGAIEFLGRVDHQVKIRGFRIELGEVEAVVSQHPAVQETVVVVREDTPGDKRLVAYVVGNNEQWAPGDLRRHLKQTLPTYMMPSVFVGLEAFPLTSNGKIDRNALPTPEAGWSEFAQDFVAPSTQAERQIAQVWEEVLGTKGISIHDNFFALGGHSLLATQVMARIKTRLQIALPLRTLFERPTVASLAEALQQAQQPSDTAEEVLAALLNNMDTLSDEEAQALLEMETRENSEKEDHS